MKMIYTLRLIILFFIGSLSACGQSNKNSSNKLNSIDKIEEITPKGWVNDFENIFNEEQKQTLANLISNFEKETSIEICIITVDTSMTINQNFNDYVLEIGRQWGVGKKEKNNGIVIGFSKSYRQIRISNGYGIEKLISDSETKVVMDEYFIKNFKQNKYYEGTFEGTIAMMNLLRTKIKK
ncbi:MAG: TPM domain-containing protein [Flavobacteriales bacterium]|nr:MAG: TPM domain-containing protein [Flavobacteriales bacterium]